MKILVVTNLYPPHHAGTFDIRCQMVSEALGKRGHQIKVLTSRYGLSSEQRDPDIERRLILTGKFDQPTFTGEKELRPIEIENNRILNEAISEFQPDVIHVWSLQGISKSLIFTLRHTRAPVVYDVADDSLSRGIGEDPWLKWWNTEKLSGMSSMWRTSLEMTGQREKLDHVAPTRMAKGYDRVPEVFGPPEAVARVTPNSVGAFRFDRLYFTSQSLKEETERAGFIASHGDIIYPGINADQFLNEVKPVSWPIKKLLIVGRLHAQSGVLTALEALKHLKVNQSLIKLNIYGRGDSDYMAQVRSFVVQHELQVEFLTVSNQTRDLVAIYRQHDAFIYPPEWNEPFSTIPLEAMAAGLPVIGSSAGGTQELFRNRDNAFVYTAGDSLELAAKITELLAQPALRVQIAENAQSEVMSRFNSTTMVDQIEAYLQNSIEAWQDQ